MLKVLFFRSIGVVKLLNLWFIKRTHRLWFFPAFLLQTIQINCLSGILEQASHSQKIHLILIVHRF